jgi:2-iminobutanoate/2-iminopropanoate deaminase
MPTPRNVVSTVAAPAAIGPYSQAVKVASLVFCSGQIALDPRTGQMVGGGDVAAETRQVMGNLAAVLEAAGTSLGKVVKTTIFLVDMGDFAIVNEVYGQSFPQEPPARATVEVRRLPRDARVEIEAIAVVD